MTKYEKLTTPLTLKHGATLKTRIAMAPMVAQASNLDGSVSENDLEFYSARAGVAGMIITGAAMVAESGRGFDHHLSIANDGMVDGLTKLAAAIKKEGNKAIIQLYHGGREAKTAYKNLGEVVAPSAIDFPFLPYTPRALTEEEILDLIKDFGKAAKRAIAAGFDGVEIHGANHYLLQQFFSSYSNIREDNWGGSLDKRMNFSLGIVKEVKRVVAENAPKDFIVGYRFSPDEVHGDTVGYTIEDSLQLIDKIADEDLDYIHTSIFTGYQDTPPGHKEAYGTLVKEKVGNRAATIIVSNIFDADAALDALNYGDIIAIGREALLEPRFAAKILEGKTDEIISKVIPGSVEELEFTEALKDWFLETGSALPPLPGQENLR